MREWQATPGLQIAIDGPSGSGKGTIASMLAAEIGLPVLDSGLLYRLIGAVAIERDIDSEDGDALAKLVGGMLESVTWTETGVSFEGENWTERLRSEEAGASASKVAVQPKVRERLLGLQRKLAQSGCIMDGRDIGTVVLVDAPAKFFLTATVRERARRRWMQLNGQNSDDGLEQVLVELKKRDQRDRERQHAPLCQAEDAIVVDSTTLRVDEVVDRMLGVLERRGLIQTIV
jgi:cytidylate kinase